MKTINTIKATNKSAKLKNSKSNLRLAILGSGLLLASAVNASEINYDAVHKQLDIMNNIIQSSVKAQRGASKAKISSINSVYLQGQGAVFTINSHSSRSLGHHSFQFVMPSAPVAPIASVDGASSTDMSVQVEYFEDNEDMVIQFESAAKDYEQAIEIYEQQRDHARDLRGEQRDIAYEIRDVARESKDYEYQIRHATKEEKQKLATKLKKLEKEKLVLQKNKVKLDEKAKQLNKQQKVQQMAQAKERKEYYNMLSGALVETLCLYGNGLKSIPKNEHVSLIVKSAGDKLGRSYKDKIYVFTKKDISDCSSDKIDTKKLLAKAEKYQF